MDIWFIPAKLGGAIAMFGSIAIFFVLPWIDRSPIRSAVFRPIYRKMYWLFLADCIMLGYVGSQPADGAVAFLPFEYYDTHIEAGKTIAAHFGPLELKFLGAFGLVYYYAHFIVLFFLPKFEKTLPLPDSIASSVLRDHAA